MLFTIYNLYVVTGAVVSNLIIDLST